MITPKKIKEALGSSKAGWLRATLMVAGLAVGGAQFADAAQRWTLATDDTVLTLGLNEQGGPAIFELKSGSRPLNWIGKASSIPLPDQVEIGGKKVSPDWAFRSAQIDKSIGTQLTLHFVSATPQLELKSEWWARPGPGPIRHADWLVNQGSEPVKIFYQPTLAIQLTVPQYVAADPKDGKLWMWYFHSDGGRPDPKGVYREQITQEFDRTMRTTPRGAMIPLVVFDLDGRHGVYVGVEWSSGNIRVTSLPQPSPSGARVEAGNSLDFSAQLEPGQIFEIPPGFIGTYNGDIDCAGNSLRKYLFRYSMPRILRTDPTYPKVQWNAFGATGKKPRSWDSVESKFYPLIDDIAPLGFEEVMLDVGWWQREQKEARFTAEPDPLDWPSGMKKAADYAHQRGMRFGLYWADNADMAAPEGRKIRGERIKGLFLKHGADIWRSDNTSGVAIKPDYWSIQGFYKMLATLQHEVPSFQWENCLSGGRLKDYGAMKRAVKIFMSDGHGQLDVRKAFHDGSFAFHPIQLMGHLGKNQRGMIRPRGSVGMKYAFRAMSMGAPEWFIDAPNGGNGGAPWTDEEKEAVKAAVATYKTKIRPLVRNADLYHIFPRPDGKVWDGIEYYDPTNGKGVVFVFKPPRSEKDVKTIKLKGLNANRTYQLLFEDGTNPQVNKSGAELINNGIDVNLKGKQVSELIFFEVAEGI